MFYAVTNQKCQILRDAFAGRYRKVYPKAVEKLLCDWERMVTFYSYPRDHWVHIRTTNVVESQFSLARLRADAARRFKSIENATAMLWMQLMVVQKKFWTLKGLRLLSDVYAGKQSVNGKMVI